ncbi:hypothetical protein GOODEAATRI_015345 [Goodea atripinnis]|uniref:Mic1 domain-containing protein n=1 Tax=Goodea atripinnis TaxID=208336 RepID=A0ABV0MHZ2_9TELE
MVLFSFREGACKKSHILKLNTTGKFALNIVDNLVVVHHQSSQEKGSLPVVATVFDKLNQVYKEYLEAEQSYTAEMESGPSRGAAAQKRPVRTQAVIDQSDMYTHVLSSFTERKDVSHKFIIAVLMEYIRSLNQYQITVQHYLYELVIKTLVQNNLFYMLHQFLQYHVLSDSKPLRLSTANDEIVEVLLSKQQVLGALRFIRSVGMIQRNQRLRGNPSFNPGRNLNLFLWRGAMCSSSEQSVSSPEILMKESS